MQGGITFPLLFGMFTIFTLGVLLDVNNSL